ncbi:inactive C-alpha-formylglycine-generating enzyme 2-like [Tubulanus polymorphus]|uniref:inactive C-alpha-formylglycine-generating enzyme 2-like n=1 Tax=Tubulanus polymorphus TaxID=672921 RepID=UPI003DA58165
MAALYSTIRTIVLIVAFLVLESHSAKKKFDESAESARIYVKRKKVTKEDLLTGPDEDDGAKGELSGMVRFFEGDFRMGINDPKYKRILEYPPRTVRVASFKIDRYPVTVEEFQKFLKAKSSFKTDAQINGHSYVLLRALRGRVDQKDVNRLSKKLKKGEPWWVYLPRATWNQPEGEGSDIMSRLDHPVTHVSYHDAHAFCTWKGKRLPSEAEWERACRASTKEWTYPWGDTFRRGSMNTWQGTFPTENKLGDGYEFTSPVNAFPPQNERGMYDMVGNVWEWTNDHYLEYGATREKFQLRKVLKGGSFVDNIDHHHHHETTANHPVRASTRKGLPLEESAQNIGFRCAKSWDVVIPEDPKPTTPPRLHKLEETWEYKKQVKERREKMKKLREQILRKRQFQILRSEEL